MSKKGQEILFEKEIKKLSINQNKSDIPRKIINKMPYPRNKISLPTKRHKIKINTKEDAFLEKKSFNNELKTYNENTENKEKEKENENIESETNKNNFDKNEFNENNDNEEQYYIDDENTANEKPPNAIEINDLIGEKCPIEIDILSINFNNYEPSKTSSKPMGLIRAYGANTYQGLVRNYNEDRVSIIINMAKPKNYGKNYWPKTSFFGIYDGHGGNQCSEFLRDSLHKLILNDSNYPENVELAIRNGFKNAEKSFLNTYALDPNDPNNILDRSGSCAVIILIVDSKAYVANVGDSRALFSEDFGKNYVEITEDHKPNNPKEKIRIIKSGGQVYQSQTVINGTEKESLNGQILFGPYRVLPGRLSVSRTIGDIEAKNENFGGNPNVIICDPDIFIYDLKKNKIDFFIMGCDGIFDQMSNEEIMDCAWMVLKNETNINDNSKTNDDENEENNEDSENPEYNFENYTIHEKCGVIVDFIIKASMVRKSFDNVTCLMIALNDFIDTEEKIEEKSSNIITTENENISNIVTTNNNSINNQIISKPKNSTRVISKRKNEIIKPKEAKLSANHVINNNPIVDDKENRENKYIIRNNVKENLKLANFMNAKNYKINTDNYPKSYRNTRTEIKNNNNYATSTHTNIMNSNKIYIRKRKERNLQKKKTNKTEITVNTDNNTSNIIIKKILNKSEYQESKKPDKTDSNNNDNNLDDKNDNKIENSDNKLEKNNIDNNLEKNKDKSNIISKSQNNNNSPKKAKNNNKTNSSNIISKLKHNKINKVPLELNSQIITNKNNWNSMNVHFYYSNTGPNNIKKLPNIKTTSIGNLSNVNSSTSHTSSVSVTNNPNYHLKPKRIKNFTKPKTFRYSNNTLNTYKRSLNKNLFNGSKTNYSSHTHNISDNSHRLYSSSNYSNSIGFRNKNRGSMSSKKKKFSYHQIIKTLSMNSDNNLQSKANKLSNIKLSYSKEKDIHSFLYKNKTNLKTNPSEGGEKKLTSNKYSKLSTKTDEKKYKKIQ
jgi:protein phosphatase 2C family protein 2/3